MPARRPQSPGKEAPSELQEAVGSLRAVAEASPEGWATVAEVLKQDTTVDVEVLLESIARLQDRYGVCRSGCVVWNDQAGVKDGFVTAISRRDWQSLVEDEARGAMLVKVPPEYVRYQVGKAIELNGKTGLPLEEHADAWNEVVGLPVEGYAPPDVVGELRERFAEERTHLVEHAGCLLESPFFQNWAFEPADLRPWYEEWQRLTAGESEEEPTTLTDEDEARLDG